MQTPGSSDQRAGSQHSKTRSTGSNSLHPPATPSISIFTSSSQSTAPSQRTPRHPDTSVESAAFDALPSRGPIGNGTFYEDDSRESSPQRHEARRKKSLGRKPSLGDLPLRSWQQQYQQAHSPPPVSRFKSLRRRTKSTNNLRGNNLPADLGASLGIGGQPPTVPPEFALPSASKLSASNRSSGDNDSAPPRPWSRAQSTSMESGRMLSRQGTMQSNGSLSASGGMMPPPSAMGMQTEATMVHQHIQEMANKRISTLEYLRKAHEGRVYWFNTLLFDKPDLARMPYFDTRRLARRATNYLLLGLSLPTVIDLAATSPTEFLRSLNLLLTEFDAFQSLHPESGSSTSGLGRARIPNLNVFRRATPSAKSRRSSSANNDVLYEDGAPAMPNGAGGGAGGGSISNISSNAGGSMSIMNGLGGSASVVSFGQSEADLLPGEEYVHLLTPSLPFDPDFFETFATLCDVLIDAYTRLLGMLPTPRECNASVAELFTKADAKVRKIIVQGIVKEFEDTSRNGVRTEVANVGKIVLGGLM